MADQNTTIASIPSGYSTIAGILYAASATEQCNWDVVVWNRVAAAFNRPRWRGGWDEDEENGPNIQPNHLHRQLINALSRCITKHSRHPYQYCDTCKPETPHRPKIADWAVALHVLILMRSTKTSRVEALHSNTASQTETTPSNRGSLSEENGGESNEETPPASDENPEMAEEHRDDPVEIAIEVKIHGDSDKPGSGIYKVNYAKDWLHTTLNSEAIRSHLPKSTTLIAEIDEWPEFAPSNHQSREIIHIQREILGNTR
ncbi:hypothetical protein G7Y89_g13413 [Cudoniella acicularis]|uniref:Uncharacterized protein n=1 Tax=Cudoniella acicularis TaxID=354080 RepID=A0A8H4R9N1_9HELO|nr:hypothetical protein G7Y89_g13413 [Cudoniella acicularis]